LPNVSITKCDSYDQRSVDEAILQSLAPLGGIEQFVKPGQKVLIKPNIIMRGTPDQAMTTHPSIISTVIRLVIKAGGVAFVGDSPGNAFSSHAKTLEETGIKEATEKAGGKIIFFQHDGVVEKNGIKIAKAVLDADIIINLPKLKTHGLTLYTGAIKNMFGCIPGFYKSQYHISHPRSLDFSKTIVDIFEAVKPQLNIMDAIVGMEGNGPTAGNPRKAGLILASADAVALDAVASYIIGFKPFDIYTTQIAHDRGIGQGELEKIKITGPEIKSLRITDWKKPFNVNILFNLIPDWLFNLIKPIANQVRVNPEIDQNKCVKCLICVKNCPAKTIDYDKDKKRVNIKLDKCINCFCCHELCEYKAIKLKPTFLARLIGISG